MLLALTLGLISRSNEALWTIFPHSDAGAIVPAVGQERSIDGYKCVDRAFRARLEIPANYTRKNFGLKVAIDQKQQLMSSQHCQMIALKLHGHAHMYFCMSPTYESSVDLPSSLIIEARTSGKFRTLDPHTHSLTIDRSNQHRSNNRPRLSMGYIMNMTLTAAYATKTWAAPFKPNIWVILSSPNNSIWRVIVVSGGVSGLDNWEFK